MSDKSETTVTAREVGLAMLFLTFVVGFVVFSIWLAVEVHPIVAGGLYACLGVSLVLFGDKIIAKYSTNKE